MFMAKSVEKVAGLLGEEVCAISPSCFRQDFRGNSQSGHKVIPGSD